MFKRGNTLNTLKFNLVTTTQSNITIVNSNSSRYLVDWNDGNGPVVMSSTSNILNTKTFSTPFTGTVSVSMIRGNAKLHIIQYGSLSGSGNSNATLNQRVDYDTNIKPIVGLQKLYLSDYQSVTGSTYIKGNFNNICNDLPQLREFYLSSKNSLSDYTIDITNLKNLNRINIDSVATQPITGTISNILTNNPNLEWLIIGISNNAPLKGSIDSFSQSTIKSITIEGNAGSNTISGDVKNLPNIGTFSIGGLNTITGSIANLPTTMKYYKNYGSNTVSGDISSLSTTLTTFYSNGLNRTNGDIANLKSNLILYINNGYNTTTGDIGLLPILMTSYESGGYNTTYGNIGSMSGSMSSYINSGSNSTTGDIATLKSGLITYNNQGLNTTYGNIGSLPTTLTSYINYGSNSTTGDIATLKSGLKTYNNQGLNTTYGNIGSLPTSLTSYTNLGNNTTYGNIGSFSTSLTYYYSSATTTGDIGLLPNKMTYFNNSNQGLNTTYGNIGSFSTSLLSFLNTGSNSVTGDLANLKSTMTTFYCISTYQSTYGNLYNLPANINWYVNDGCMTSSFTASGGATKSWGNLWRFSHLPKAGYGLTSSDVDQLLISLAPKSYTWNGQTYSGGGTWTTTSGKNVTLNANNGPRTAASDAAVMGLSAIGVQVRVNGRFGAN